jgi:hypothetical protein
MTACYASVSGAAWGDTNANCNDITRDEDGISVTNQ